ncbi:DUF5986 family protein [Caldibacillus thermoamylovorans]|nr:DUF5986 family protein [Caldibacillus thermoamylovorans]
MKIISGLNDETIESLVKAFAGTTNDVVDEIKQEYGLETGNFKNGGVWDIRFRRIKQVALENGLIVLTKRRGIWTFICVLDTGTGILYVFSKEKNLDIVIKKLGRKNIHYFHAFVSLSSGPIDLDYQQISLFPTLTEEYENRRLREAQKILGEEYPLVNDVVFIVAKEEEKKIVGVEAKTFNRYFELLDTQDWSMYVPEDEYSNLFVLEEDTIDNTDTVMVIPKVKQEVKDRKHHFDKTIPSKKEEKKDLKEEDQS